MKRCLSPVITREMQIKPHDINFMPVKMVTIKKFTTINTLRCDKKKTPQYTVDGDIIWAVVTTENTMEVLKKDLRPL